MAQRFHCVDALPEVKVITKSTVGHIEHVDGIHKEKQGNPTACEKGPNVFDTGRVLQPVPNLRCATLCVLLETFFAFFETLGVFITFGEIVVEFVTIVTKTALQSCVHRSGQAGFAVFGLNNNVDTLINRSQATPAAFEGPGHGFVRFAAATAPLYAGKDDGNNATGDELGKGGGRVVVGDGNNQRVVRERQTGGHASVCSSCS